jgi:hypothetical protein
VGYERRSLVAIPLTLFSSFRRLLLKLKTDLSRKGRGKSALNLRFGHIEILVISVLKLNKN